MRPTAVAKSVQSLYRIWTIGVMIGMVATLVLASCGTAEVGQQGNQDAKETTTTRGEKPEPPGPPQGARIQEIANNPEEFYGERVTVTGRVTEAVEPNTFRVGSGGEQLLVVGAQQLSRIAKGERKEVNEGDYVRATGEVQQFKIEEVRNEVDYGIDNEYFGDFEGDPAVLASSFEVRVQEGTERTAETGQEPETAVQQITNNPDEFYEESVTVSGQVADVVRPNAFLIGGDGNQLLVVGTRELKRKVDEGDRVRVAGTVRQFAIDNFRKEFDRGIDNEYFREFEGKPAVYPRSVEVIE